ncbi:heptaprenylglyceryl phosphate synthase [Insulibacter thermoxylanivorax]|uniref:Heptaprenylglyceryl phosphate synthase n=1 Tax=Insulibacter thermoxylanivorax TaxID=2749268 RepID=A0A916VIN8_9BACL|nr:heptaprenylglyceryl phosphate synthase [Insulibacter thermoxylanivorax]GFR39560.1 heptaprenylglyceryl phosphate synthase [Insulibacter thermoxylanivorax]
MHEDIRHWRHVFKLDPDKEISDEHLDRICTSGTDAIVVGGSTGVTFDNTIDLLARVRRYELPCVSEISTIEAVVPGFDLYLIPVVLNSRQGQWITGRHREALKQFGKMLPWESLVPEGYVVLNEDSTVARLTQADANLGRQDVIACANLSEKLFRLPVCYLEYSGKFGDMDLVREVRDTLEESQLFYGGGIDSAERARQALAAADTIVVGNIIYEDIERALETVVDR